MVHILSTGGGAYVVHIISKGGGVYVVHTMTAFDC